jgi:hypothetical protein
MKPRTQLRFANLMMTVGVTPWLLALIGPLLALWLANTLRL